MLDLAVLLKRCEAGDALAWEALVRRFKARIFALAFYYIRDREEARDLAQEIFLRIYKSLNNGLEPDSFIPWMLATARNCCIDRLRKNKRRPPLMDGRESLLPEAEDFRQGPDGIHESKVKRTLIHRALDKLNGQNREIILLKEIQGLKFKEIAELLGIPVGTVKSRSGRARIELAKVVMELDPSYARNR